MTRWLSGLRRGAPWVARRSRSSDSDGTFRHAPRNLDPHACTDLVRRCCRGRRPGRHSPRTCHRHRGRPHRDSATLPQLGWSARRWRATSRPLYPARHSVGDRFDRATGPDHHAAAATRSASDPGRFVQSLGQDHRGFGDAGRDERWRRQRSDVQPGTRDRYRATHRRFIKRAGPAAHDAGQDPARRTRHQRRRIRSERASCDDHSAPRNGRDADHRVGRFRWSVPLSAL